MVLCLYVGIEKNINVSSNLSLPFEKHLFDYTHNFLFYFFSFFLSDFSIKR